LIEAGPANNRPPFSISGRGKRLPTARNEARRIAANIAKLPELAGGSNSKAAGG
jgi:hypothetical protein